MILSGQSIRNRCDPYEPVDMGHGNVDYRDNPNVMITPFVERTVHGGRSYGLSYAGYDIRIDKWNHPHGFEGNGPSDSIRMDCGNFLLASSIERIKMPNDLMCIVHDKSSWAREGLALQNTVLEPGWEGFITLELTFHRPQHHIILRKGDPIAQLVFHRLDEPVVEGYQGKYQNQADMPVEARLEKTVDFADVKTVADSEIKRVYTGTLCSVCYSRQFLTPSGICCENGHGGADEAEELEQTEKGIIGQLKARNFP